MWRWPRPFDELIDDRQPFDSSLAASDLTLGCHCLFAEKADLTFDLSNANLA
jgi:hypothetical protein